jgi:heterodisulfide reductase subunit A-like polyferredoxin
MVDVYTSTMYWSSAEVSRFTAAIAAATAGASVMLIERNGCLGGF